MDQIILNCQFCQNKYDIVKRVPRMIFECGHSICSICLEQQFQNNTTSIQCPQDKIIISLLGKTQDIFPVNQTVIEILKKCENQTLSVQSLEKLESPPRRQSNSNSSKNEIFSSFGTNAQQMKNMSINEIGRPSSIDNMKQCEYHQKELDTVCFRCQQLICMQCALFDQHKNHKVEKIESFIEHGEGIYKQLQENKTGIQNQLQHTKQKYFEEIIKPLYKLKQSHVKKDIKKCYKIAIANLKRQEEEVQIKVDNVFEEFNQKFDQKFQNAFDDFKDDINSWMKDVNSIDEQSSKQNNIDKLFYVLNINQQNELISKSNHIQKKMNQVIHAYDNKAKNYLDSIKIEQKISYEDYFFDIVNPQLDFESQLYNIDINLTQDLQSSNLFNEQLPDTNRDILLEIQNNQFKKNKNNEELNETNFQDDNLFQDVNVSEVSELSLSKVEQQKSQTFDANNIHNIMQKHRKFPQNINFQKIKTTEHFQKVPQPPKLTNQTTLKNLNTLNKFDILSQHTGMNLGDNFHRKTNSNKKLLKSGQENISKRSRSISNNRKNTKSANKTIFKGEKGEIILKLQKDLVTDLDLSYYSNLKRINQRTT